MQLTSFHTLRTAVQDNAGGPSQADLMLMSAELELVLEASGLFSQIEVGTTDNPDAFVVALCQYKPDLDEHLVAGEIARVWEHRVRYPFWEAHSLIVHPGHVEFEGATRISQSGHFSTVHLVAQQSLVPSQRMPQQT
ncbi:MAG: hypothetical protein HZY75_05835 [Nocardioidaceae bacterium]|nr:MAG: hypothetical protein HZY75_05835 [Nocardioidaceae bacterium]